MKTNVHQFNLYIVVLNFILDFFWFSDCVSRLNRFTIVFFFAKFLEDWFSSVLCQFAFKDNFYWLCLLFFNFQTLKKSLLCHTSSSGSQRIVSSSVFVSLVLKWSRLSRRRLSRDSDCATFLSPGCSQCRVRVLYWPRVTTRASRLASNVNVTRPPLSSGHGDEDAFSPECFQRR